MNLSMKWLKDYVDINPDAKDFSEKMTMSGSKVEGWETEGQEINKVVVGKVLSVVPHQNSDHLVVCQVKWDRKLPSRSLPGHPMWCPAPWCRWLWTAPPCPAE